MAGKFASWLGDALGNTAGELISGVGNTVDRFVHTKEERAELQFELEKLRKEHELSIKRVTLDAEEIELRDRLSAREMYAKDSTLQKIYAMTFLVGYLVISTTMVLLVMQWIGVKTMITTDVPGWGVSLISTVFGAMSSKVNTITDFLFGGSQGERDFKRVQQSFEGQAQTHQQDQAKDRQRMMPGGRLGDPADHQ